ncbi:hypothetical protein QBC35DRAFT_470153 [Podospora australis]|uniref:Uncharacterized protein n=1 Tax=Podospora australis TaxID=1536484 RepID=A0AAN6X1N5_9PEZI|nr:hypothetical protein QBC35DRAFT_470153 [Podospora australis]
MSEPRRSGRIAAKIAAAKAAADADAKTAAKTTAKTAPKTAPKKVTKKQPANKKQPAAVGTVTRQQHDALQRALDDALERIDELETQVEGLEAQINAQPDFGLLQKRITDLENSRDELEKEDKRIQKRNIELDDELDRLKEKLTALTNKVENAENPEVDEEEEDDEHDYYEHGPGIV